MLANKSTLNLIAQLRLTERGLAYATLPCLTYLLVVTDVSPTLYQEMPVILGRLLPDDSARVSLPVNYQPPLSVIGVDAKIAAVWMGVPIEGVLNQHDLVMPIIREKGLKIIAPPSKIAHKSKYRDVLKERGVLEMEKPEGVGDTTWWTGVEFAKGRSINELARVGGVTASGIQARLITLIRQFEREKESEEGFKPEPTPEEIEAGEITRLGREIALIQHIDNPY